MHNIIWIAIANATGFRGHFVRALVPVSIFKRVVSDYVSNTIQIGCRHSDAEKVAF